jgi:hypothetical protein
VATGDIEDFLYGDGDAVQRSALGAGNAVERRRIQARRCGAHVAKCPDALIVRRDSCERRVRAL